MPRSVDQLEATWLSRLLPDVFGKYFEKRRRDLVMWHAVPTVFAKNKDQLEVFQRHWNAHVSPGEAIYAHHGEGEATAATARRTGLLPREPVHEKEVFL